MSNASKLYCVYCGSAGPFTDEHVLARAFAGPNENWMLKDLVCAECNTLFSAYERAWTSAPGEAYARIHWGPAGRKRKGAAYQAHPSENIFLMINGDPILYEADILRGSQPRLRPQTILTGTGLLPLAGAAHDIPRLNKAANSFWKNRELTIQKRLKPGPRQFRIAVFAQDQTFRIEKIELRPKPADAWLDRFPAGVFNVDPRMSVDADGRLRFRSRRLRDVPATLNAMLGGQVTSRPYSQIAASQLTLAVRSPFSEYKVFRAIAKTVVNHAVDYFGRDWIANPPFRPILDYCLGRIGDPPGSPFVGVLPSQPTGIQAIDACPPERHALVLCSNGARVIGLVRLYGGTTYRVHLGQPAGGIARFIETVWIDFNGPGRVPVGT
jgi:hypothetical protein